MSAGTRSRRRVSSTSSLRPRLAGSSFSQPNVRVVQPSPRILRSRTARTTLDQTQSVSSSSPVLSQARRSQNERAVSTQPTAMIPINTEMVEDPPETLSCPICTIDVADNIHGLFCENCFSWYHAQCIFIPDDEYVTISNSEDKWFCDHCSSIRANKIKWGSLEGENSISTAISDAYSNVIKWKKNIFALPEANVEQALSRNSQDL